MKSPTVTVRLISAATAVAITLLLLGTVFQIAEPQRSVLIAKMQHSEQQPTAAITVAMASNGSAKHAR